MPRSALIRAGSTYAMGPLVPSCGGPPLHTLALEPSMFAASAMEAGGGLPFEEMKLPQLKDELAARGMPHSGLETMLQRKLHTALVLAAQSDVMDT